MQIKTAAKVNLSLSLRGRGKNGYQLLDSYVCFVDYYDVMTIERDRENSVVVTGPFAHKVNPEENSILQTLEVLYKLNPKIGHFRIQLQKNIPVGAGLGGGSGNAAGILRVFAKLFPGDVMLKIAKSISADVPVCLFNRPARVQGIGEKLNSIQLPFAEAPILLVSPNKHIDTSEVFALTRKLGNGSTGDKASTQSPLTWHNNLEAAAKQIYPEIVQFLQSMRRQMGARACGMSGSGGTCYAIFDTVENRDDALNIMQNYALLMWKEATYHSGRILPDPTAPVDKSSDESFDQE